MFSDLCLTNRCLQCTLLHKSYKPVNKTNSTTPIPPLLPTLQPDHPIQPSFSHPSPHQNCSSSEPSYPDPPKHGYSSNPLLLSPSNVHIHLPTYINPNNPFSLPRYSYSSQYVHPTPPSILCPPFPYTTQPLIHTHMQSVPSHSPTFRTHHSHSQSYSQSQPLNTYTPR